jgi:hypothetical protein
MSIKGRMGHISVRPTTYKLVKEHCLAQGISMSEFLDQITADIAGTDIDRTHNYRCNACGKRGHNRRTCPELHEDLLGDDMPVPVSEALHSMLEDQVVRERELHGRDVSPSYVLEAAINRTLDALGAPR